MICLAGEGEEAVRLWRIASFAESQIPPFRKGGLPPLISPEAIMETIFPHAPWLPLLERLLVSILCGAIIGLEREWARKVAGLRTMILICMGSALYMSVSELAALRGPEPFDITRIAAQVVTGVGFIGAGTIIVARGQIHGITTAATIWVVAAIGLIVGAGYPYFGLLVTGIVLGILILIGFLEKRLVEAWFGDKRGEDLTSEESSSHPLLPGQHESNESKGSIET